VGSQGGCRCRQMRVLLDVDFQNQAESLKTQTGRVPEGHRQFDVPSRSGCTEHPQGSGRDGTWKLLARPVIGQRTLSQRPGAALPAL
jgi:hypothetical protein